MKLPINCYTSLPVLAVKSAPLPSLPVSVVPGVPGSPREGDYKSFLLQQNSDLCHQEIQSSQRTHQTEPYKSFKVGDLIIASAKRGLHQGKL